MSPVTGFNTVPEENKTRFANVEEARQEQDSLHSLMRFRPDFLVVNGENWGLGYHFYIKAEFIVRYCKITWRKHSEPRGATRRKADRLRT